MALNHSRDVVHSFEAIHPKVYPKAGPPNKILLDFGDSFNTECDYQDINHISTDLVGMR